jgi:hypothetical protein
MARDHAGQPSNNPWLTLDVDNLTVAEPNVFPNNLIDQALVVNRNIGYALTAEFKLGGFLSNLITSLMASAPGSDFEVMYKFESMGAGVEGNFGAKNVSAVSGQLEYKNADTRLNIAAGTGPGAGTYKVVATVRCLHATGGFIAGYVEGPIIQII